MGSIQQVLLGEYAAAGGSFGPGPDSISGLKIWFDAFQETGYSNGDQISTLLDFSGNSNNATGISVAGSKPIYRSSDGPNSRPAVKMADLVGIGRAGGYFTLPDFASAFTAGHGFSVMKKLQDPPSSSTPCGLLSDFSSNFASVIDVIPYTNGHLYCGFGTTVRKEDIVNSVGSMTSWRLYEERSASGAWSNYLDGTQLFTTGTNTVGFSTAPKLGFTSAVSAYMEGYFAETFVYNRILNSTEITTIKTYLNTKYALSII